MLGFAGALGTSSFLHGRRPRVDLCSTQSGRPDSQVGVLRSVPLRMCASPENAVDNSALEVDAKDLTDVAFQIGGSVESAADNDAVDVDAVDLVDGETENADFSTGYVVSSEQNYTSVKLADELDEDQKSYHSVVDVNITVGGVLGETDEDNNELFCGVGFDALLENEKLVENLEQEFSITTATHVQMAAIPRIMSDEDVVIQGHTGTGKTFAFLLPVLEDIDPEKGFVQALVIAPTRELAMQISNECSRLCEGTGIVNLAIIGGANPARQVEKLKKRAPHVVIGTPGRLAELLDQRALSLRRLNYFVVDEVDHCLQEPFRDALVGLLESSHRSRQVILVSATSDVSSVREFAKRHMQEPVLLRVGDKQLLPNNISNYYTVVPQRLHIETLRKLMFAEPMPSKAICFVDDPRRAGIVLERLYKNKVAAAGLRGTADKQERAEVLKAFRKGIVQLLVTTEVAARGLDINDVSHVFNLDLPTDADHYVHRAGRCGRVGREGVVVSIAAPENAFVIGRLARQLGAEIIRIEPRGGRYAPPLDRKTIREKLSKKKSTDEVGATIPGKKEPSNEEGISPRSASNERKVKNAVVKEALKAKTAKNTENEMKKPRKKPKKRMTEAEKRAKANSLPKSIRGSKGITNFAKSHGWVGNRD